MSPVFVRPRTRASPMLPPPTNPTRLSWTDTSVPSTAREVGAPVHASASPGAEHRRAYPHDRRSLLDAHLEIAAHPHRELRELDAQAPAARGFEQLPHLPVVRPGVLRILGKRWDRHQPADPEALEP